MSENGYSRQMKGGPIPDYSQNDDEDQLDKQVLQPLNQRQVAQAMRLVN